MQLKNIKRKQNLEVMHGIMYKLRLAQILEEMLGVVFQKLKYQSQMPGEVHQKVTKNKKSQSNLLLRGMQNQQLQIFKTMVGETLTPHQNHQNKRKMLKMLGLLANLNNSQTQMAGEKHNLQIMTKFRVLILQMLGVHLEMMLVLGTLVVMEEHGDKPLLLSMILTIKMIVVVEDVAVVVAVVDEPALNVVKKAICQENVHKILVAVVAVVVADQEPALNVVKKATCPENVHKVVEEEVDQELVSSVMKKAT